MKIIFTREILEAGWKEKKKYSLGGHNLHPLFESAIKCYNGLNFHVSSILFCKWKNQINFVSMQPNQLFFFFLLERCKAKLNIYEKYTRNERSKVSQSRMNLMDSAYLVFSRFSLKNHAYYTRLKEQIWGWA